MASEGSLEGPARRLGRDPPGCARWWGGGWTGCPRRQTRSSRGGRRPRVQSRRARGPERQAPRGAGRRDRAGDREPGGVRGAALAGGLLLLARARPRDSVRGAHRTPPGGAPPPDRRVAGADLRGGPGSPGSRARPPLHRRGAGGEADKAIAYAERAARRASDQLAHEDAATHYERALEVLDFAGVRSGRRLALLLELGEAQRRPGGSSPAARASRRRRRRRASSATPSPSRGRRSA